MPSVREYKQAKELTIAELELLSQAYTRSNVEGYTLGWSFTDFLDIVTAQGDYANTKCDAYLYE